MYTVKLREGSLTTLISKQLSLIRSVRSVWATTSYFINLLFC